MDLEQGEGKGRRHRTRSLTRRTSTGLPSTSAKRKREGEEETSATKKMANLNGHPAPPPGGAAAADATINLSQFQVLLDSTLETRLAATRAEIGGDIEKSVGKLQDRVALGEASLAAHKVETSRQLKKINERLNKLSGKEISIDDAAIKAEIAKQVERVDKNAGGGRGLGGGEHERKQCWWSRRCLKMAPVCREEKREIWNNLESFIKDSMKVPSHDIDPSDIVDTRRLRPGRGRAPKNEVLVVFADVATRDRIQSYARNLGSLIDAADKPLATVRPDVPAHLGGVYKTLLQYGHALKEKYGRDFRRNIRHEDAEHSYCIDVCFKRDGEWITIGYERALADRKSNNKAWEMSQGDKLSSRTDGEDGDAMEQEGSTNSWGTDK